MGMNMNIITDFCALDVKIEIEMMKVHWKLVTDGHLRGNDGGLNIYYTDSDLAGFKDLVMKSEDNILLKGLVFTGDSTTLEKLLKDWAKQSMAFLRKVGIVRTMFPVEAASEQPEDGLEQPENEENLSQDPPEDEDIVI